jgi:Protein of unknown function (DUF4197)
MKAEWVLVVGLASILVGCGKTDPAPPVSAVPQAPAEAPPIPRPTVVGAPASTPPPPPTTPAPPPVVPATVVTAAPVATAAIAPSVAVPETANPPARAQKALDTLKRVVDAIPQVQPPVSGAVPTTPAAAATAATVSDLPVDQVTKGLKEALGKGLEHAVASLGKSGGFLTNRNVKIPIPEKFQTVEKTLRTIGQERLADEFVTTMNQAAEQAVPAAAAVFKESLQKMTVADAKKILTGPNDAATRYFRETTQADLTARFLPIVQKATAASGATAAYKQVTDKVKLAGPLVRVPELDLDGYVTAKALDGLFVRVAEEERRIRETPAARGTELLQKVFGAMGR